MKLLHIIDTLDPDHGGPSMVALRLAAAQALMGHEVTILAYAEPDATARTSKSLEGIPGIKALRFATLSPPASLSEKIRASEARAWLDQNLAGVQMLHLHGVWEAILRVAGERARARGEHRVSQRLVVHVGGALPAALAIDEQPGLEQPPTERRIARVSVHGQILCSAAIFAHGSPAMIRQCASKSWTDDNLGGRPILTPRARAASIPSLVRSISSSRSNSAFALMIVYWWRP